MEPSSRGGSNYRRSSCRCSTQWNTTTSAEIIVQIRFHICQMVEAQLSFDGTGVDQCSHGPLQTVMQAHLTVSLPDEITVGKQVSEFHALITEKYRKVGRQLHVSVACNEKVHEVDVDVAERFLNSNGTIDARCEPIIGRPRFGQEFRNTL
jgi:hypothetical protein